MSRRTKYEGLSWVTLRKRWSAWYAEKSPVLIFGCKFGLLVLLLYLVLDLPVGERLLFAYLKVNASLADLALRLLGQHTHVADGVVIQSTRFSIAIRRGCDAVEPTWLLCAAILAFPAPLIKKIGGILAATLVLQILNIVRIVSLYSIGAYWPSFFNSAHMELWPTLFIVVAIVFFLRWKGVSLEQGRGARA